MVKIKNKILSYALFFSFLAHILGFSLIRVKMLSAQVRGEYLEVGLFESGWQEALVELPGNSDNENEIFKTPRHLRGGLGKAITPFENKIQNPNLPDIKSKDATSIVSDRVEKATETPSDFSSVHTDAASAKRLIEGPASSRKVLFSKYPDYPDWAQSYGLEFEVKLRFWVAASGEVNRVSIERSSGYPEVDAEVVRAMKRWRFDWVEESAEGTQWGTVLFKFRLKA